MNVEEIHDAIKLCLPFNVVLIGRSVGRDMINLLLQEIVDEIF